MHLIANLARWELLFLIAGFGILTLWKVFQSGSFAGLLRTGDGSFSPGRVQLLVLTLLTAIQYLLTTIHDPSHLPSLPAGLVAATGGSQAIYLGTKAWGLFGAKKSNQGEK